MKNKIKALSFDKATCEITSKLQRAGHKAVVVGGFLRKALTGLPPKDVDISTSATPSEVRAVFGVSRVRSNNGEAHGTVLVIPLEKGSEPIEVTTFRLDVETDGRRAVTKFTRSIREDLIRRDLTVNAIAIDPHTKEMFGTDPDGSAKQSLADLEAGRIQFVGDGKVRIAEDNLRVLRAVRFACEADNRHLSDQAKKDIKDTIHLLPGQLSGNRIGDEIIKTLSGKFPRRAMELFVELGLLDIFIPELTPLIGQKQNQFHGGNDVFTHTMETLTAPVNIPDGVGLGVFRLAMLLHDSGKPSTATPREGSPDEFRFIDHHKVGQVIAGTVARRWKLSNKDRQVLEAVAREHMGVPDDKFSESGIRRWANKIKERWGSPMIEILLAARLADRNSRSREATEADIRRVRAIMVKSKKRGDDVLAINGADVMRILSIRPGRQVGIVLKKIKGMVLDNPSINNKEELTTILKEMS